MKKSDYNLIENNDSINLRGILSQDIDANFNLNLYCKLDKISSFNKEIF